MEKINYTLGFIFLLVVIFHCHAREKKMIAFDISIESEEFALQEPIYIDFKIKNQGDPIELPFAYDETDVVTLFLYNDKNEVIGTMDGYMQAEKSEGKSLFREKQGNLKTATLAKDQTLAWGEDLLTYFNLKQPGTYYIRAFLKFEPQSLALYSNKQKFAVLPSMHNYVDIINDPLSLFSVCYLKQFVKSNKWKTFYKIPSNHNLEEDYVSGKFRKSLGNSPLLSLNGNSERLEPVKWIVWKDKQNIQYTNFYDEKPLKVIYTYDPGLDNFEIIGRPVCGIDSGLKIFLLTMSRSNEYCLLELSFSQDGKFKSKEELYTCNYRPSPFSICVNKTTIYAAFGKNDTLPLQLINLSEKPCRGEEIFTDKSLLGLYEKHPDDLTLKVVGIIPDLVTMLTSAELKEREQFLKEIPKKVGDAMMKMKKAVSSSVLAAVTIKKKDKQVIKLVRIPVSNDPSPDEQVKIIHIDPDPLKISSKNNFIGANLIQAQYSGLNALFMSDNGALYYYRENEPLEAVAKSSPRLVNKSILLTGEKYKIFLLYPDEHKGVVSKLLFDPDLP